jgi:rRNA maturation RNase YbeY
MKPRRPRHLRLVDDSAADPGDETEFETDGVEILLTDSSGFDWTDDADNAGVVHERLERLVAEVVEDEGVSTGTLHLYLIDPGFMGYLNKTFMGYDGPTDVLAFPIDGPEMAGGGGVDLSLVRNTGVDAADGEDADQAYEGALGAGDAVRGVGGDEIVDQSIDDEYVDWDDDYDSVPIHLGDVMVCPQVAARQAPDHTGSLPAELSLLVIHGVLHVLGHNHAEPAETARMRGRERRYLARLGYRHPVDR